VINAFVHNDYATNEVPPVFEIFSDRLVITFMGGLPFGMTEGEFFEGVSNPRKKVLMRVFKDMDLVEQLGSGMERILAVYDKNIFKISSNYIKVTFVFGDKTAISGDKMAISGDKTAIILDQKEAILNYAKENSQFRSKDIQELLNLGSSRVRKILSEMCEEKLIEKHGVNKGTYYTRR